MQGLALLIIDVQDSFLKVIPHSEELLKRCGFAIESANLFGIKTFYTEQYSEKLKETHTGLLEKGLNQCKCFKKNAFSAFGVEDFEDHLRKEGIEHLLIAGVETSICVYQTIMDALRLDFEVTMLSDCVAGRRENDSQAVTAYLQKTECHILPSETVFFSLFRTGQHPNFKQFNQIVKKYS
ncbi:MAG: isochorismatase [Verrucomicrobia bacterium]|nr:MAG: isochorismatase [Verrucomicrobiota bacterium]